MTSSNFWRDVISEVFRKNGYAGMIYLKIDRIVDFDIKTSEKSFRPVGSFWRRYDVMLKIQF